MTVRNSIPQCEVPTEMYMELLKLLDMLSPVLEDWIQLTGFGEMNLRGQTVLAQVHKCKAMHRRNLLAHGIDEKAWRSPEGGK